jgi:hypothetical protein
VSGMSKMPGMAGFASHRRHSRPLPAQAEALTPPAAGYFPSLPGVRAARSLFATRTTPTMKAVRSIQPKRPYASPASPIFMAMTSIIAISSHASALGDRPSMLIIQVPVMAHSRPRIPACEILTVLRIGTATATQRSQAIVFSMRRGLSSCGGFRFLLPALLLASTGRIAWSLQKGGPL